MMDNALFNEYDQLDLQLELLEEDANYDMEGVGLGIRVVDKQTSFQFNLSRQTLAALNRGSPEGIRGFELIESLGFIHREYCEVSIDIINGRNPTIRGFTTWNEPDLKFSIGETRVDVGAASRMFAFMMEPIYGNSDFLPPFNELTTIRLFGTQRPAARNRVVQALYYLNSHYLRDIGYSAILNHLEVDYDEMMYEGQFEESLTAIHRARRRRRPGLASTEPLNLYNYSKTCAGTERFLYLYRILEFFMRRALLQKTHDLRCNEAVSDDKLLAELTQRNERQLLANLLQRALSAKHKDRIVQYALHKGLIRQNEFSELANGLYDTRNSIVHAKEQQIDAANIPDPFTATSIDDPWTRIVEDIAVQAITRFNTSATQ